MAADLIVRIPLIPRIHQKNLVSCVQWHKTRNPLAGTKSVGCLQFLRRAAPKNSPLRINCQIRAIACCIRHIGN